MLRSTALFTRFQASHRSFRESGQARTNLKFSPSREDRVNEVDRADKMS